MDAARQAREAKKRELLRELAELQVEEMFWDDPDGAEAILRLRAASLSDDGRLDRHLATRPGHPFVRRTTPAIAT